MISWQLIVWGYARNPSCRRISRIISSLNLLNILLFSCLYLNELCSILWDLTIVLHKLLISIRCFNIGIVQCNNTMLIPRNSDQVICSSVCLNRFMKLYTTSYIHAISSHFLLLGFLNRPITLIPKVQRCSGLQLHLSLEIY